MPIRSGRDLRACPCRRPTVHLVDLRQRRLVLDHRLDRIAHARSPFETSGFIAPPTLGFDSRPAIGATTQLHAARWRHTRSPVWRHWLEGLAEGHTVIRYDERGCGLSDRNVEDVSLEARVADLEAVIDDAGFERVDLLGMSQGGPVAIAYAARHPERVQRLVLYATYARGRLKRDLSPSEREHAELMVSLIRMGWGQGQPAFRRLFTTLFIPDASAEQMEWFDELQRVTTDPETALRIRAARNQDDVTDEATCVSSPTLVLHARDDALVSFSEGRLLATLIPGARFVALEGRNHILLPDELAWNQFRGELHAFLETAVDTSTPDELS